MDEWGWLEWGSSGEGEDCFMGGNIPTLRQLKSRDI